MLSAQLQRCLLPIRRPADRNGVPERRAPGPIRRHWPPPVSGILVLLPACGGAANPPVGGTDTIAKSGSRGAFGLSEAAQLGQKLFSDTSLSASGRLSCATCHNPSNAHAPVNNLAMQPGGADGLRTGFRTTPSLRYLNATPAFFFDRRGTPTGGFNHDGRAATLAEQARRPFLSEHEMANRSSAGVTDRLRAAAYADQFRQVFGDAIFDDPEQALNRATFALQQFQKEDPAFSRFDSRYDRFLAGQIRLDEAEMRGLALFNDRSKGNCLACHPSAKSADGRPPMFTDFTFDNLGVPRNAAIVANADPAFFDLGLCGPDRNDLSQRTEQCGKFKVPTLRNVATRRSFFHNGRFATLREVLGFYVRRDTNPEEWYPRAPGGQLSKFDDLPVALQSNVNRTEAPYNRVPGMMPALSANEIDDLIAFLRTLTDADLTNP